MKIETNATSAFDIKISPSQTKIACALIGHPLSILDIKTGEVLVNYTDRNYDSAWTVDWYKHNDKEYVVSGYGTGGYVRIIGEEGKDMLKYTRKSTDYGYPDAAQLHSNSIWKLVIVDNYSYSVSDDGTIARLQLEFREDAFVYTRKHEKKTLIWGNIYNILPFDSDHLVIAIGHDIAKIRILQKKFLNTYSEHNGRVRSLCKLSERTFVSASEDHSIKLWDIDKEEALKTIQLDATPTQVKCFNDYLIHSQGNQLVIRNKDLELVKEITLVAEKIICFDLTNDGKTLVVGDENGNIFIEEFVIK